MKLSEVNKKDRKALLDEYTMLYDVYFSIIKIHNICNSKVLDYSRKMESLQRDINRLKIEAKND